MKKNQVCFSIVPRGPSVASNDWAVEASNKWVTDGNIDPVPNEIVELLNEYKEISIEDILDGLPPIRSISYCIDLSFRAIFHNKAPYRLTSTENEELNR